LIVSSLVYCLQSIEQLLPCLPTFAIEPVYSMYAVPVQAPASASVLLLLNHRSRSRSLYGLRRVQRKGARRHSVVVAQLGCHTHSGELALSFKIIVSKICELVAFSTAASVYLIRCLHSDQIVVMCVLLVNSRHFFHHCWSVARKT